MRPLILYCILLLVCTSVATSAAEEGTPPWSLQAEGQGLYTLEIDSTRTKSTIVEFDDRIYLIEVSLSDEGGGARTLREHREGGESILRILDAEFAGKPLAAVLHSHWHPHSLASVAPFLERGVALVTTRANFERVKEFVDPSLLAAQTDLIRYVEGESLTLGSGDETIVVHRLRKEDYASLPTPDYLFFEIPSLSTLHTGCMYSISRNEPVAGREVIPSRAIDLHAFLDDAQLDLDGLLRVYLDSDEKNTSEVIPVSRLAHTIATGVTVAELSARFTKYTASELREHRDRLIRESVVDKVPPSLLNGLVFRELGARNLEKALELATLQTLLAPADANAWDTLGEAHYFRGEVEVARFYEEQSRTIDPGFDRGGVAVWEKELGEHRERWAQLDAEKTSDE